MARIDEVKREDLSPRQQQVYDDIMRSRPRPTPHRPILGLIHTPDIAEPADRLVNCFRTTPKLDRRLLELIILLMCRDATVQYAWSVHEPLALKQGLSQDTIDAIRARKRPDFERDDERLIYDVVTELLAEQDRDGSDLRPRQGGVRPRRLDRGCDLCRVLRHDRIRAQRLRDSAATRTYADVRDWSAGRKRAQGAPQ